MILRDSETRKIIGNQFSNISRLDDVILVDIFRDFSLQIVTSVQVINAK